MQDRHCSEADASNSSANSSSTLSSSAAGTAEEVKAATFTSSGTTHDFSFSKALALALLTPPACTTWWMALAMSCSTCPLPNSRTSWGGDSCVASSSPS